jgi:alkanesulfonate monooxygenase SsuD/methylene tetrahydromethanopterin reductase-like flavin-dependent oxidoreductase (luciferase family)
MTHHRPLEFGISVTPYAEAYPQIVEQVLTAERTGFELVGIQDHPYQRRFLDTFSLIADLLARTSHLRLFPDVASLPMRPPTMLAKAAASLDVMSGGRFELGLGAGNFWDAVEGMGGSRREPGELGAALEEGLDLIRAALDVGPDRGVVRGPGPFYPIPGYPPGPPTAHRVEIWIGAMAPRALELIGRKADGWIPAGGVSRIDEFAGLGKQIDDAAAAAGRDPRLVRRIVNVMTDVTAETVQPWIERLTTWAVEPGVDAYVFWPQDAGTAMIERIAAEVIPAVRDATATRR